ncbi:MAG TPA: type III pantothenate kinase, partial [Clostridiales bacterium]|nr:type III pantothenate kinase [Clostridiales bacterium]
SPGVRLSLDALAQGASQLSQISLDTPKRVIGTNTVDSMRSGIVYGTADMLDGMIDRINQEMPLPAKTILATGGLSGICLQCRHDIKIDKSLLLKGLKALFELNTDA